MPGAAAWDVWPTRTSAAAAAARISPDQTIQCGGGSIRTTCSGRFGKACVIELRIDGCVLDGDFLGPAQTLHMCLDHMRNDDTVFRLELAQIDFHVVRLAIQPTRQPLHFRLEECPG